MNHCLSIDVFTVAVTPDNALDLLSAYDIIVDCTDNLPTRYLLSDAAVALGKPLVSGAAQKFEGQLCVFNLGPKGPCYRCLYPSPPPQETVGSCAELGILGVVTGTIGNQQALETIKIILGWQGRFDFLYEFRSCVFMCRTKPFITPLQCTYFSPIPKY